MSPVPARESNPRETVATRSQASPSFAPECAHPLGTSSDQRRFASPDSYTPKQVSTARTSSSRDTEIPAVASSVVLQGAYRPLLLALLRRDLPIVGTGFGRVLGHTPAARRNEF